MDQIDDGYDWKGPANRQIAQVSNEYSIEVTQFFGGHYDYDPSASVCRMEFRMAVPNNRLYLVHYLLLGTSGMPIVPDTTVPSGTVNPAMVFNRPGAMKPPMAVPPKAMPQMMHRPVPPVVNKPVPKPIRVPTTQESSQNTVKAVDESSYLPIDDLDAISKVDVAMARMKFVRSVLKSLFSPREDVQIEAAENAALEELFESSIELLRQEVELLQTQSENWRRADQERRRALNDLFTRSLDADVEFIVYF